MGAVLRNRPASCRVLLAQRGKTKSWLMKTDRSSTTAAHVAAAGVGLSGCRSLGRGGRSASRLSLHAALDQDGCVIWRVRITGIQGDFRWGRATLCAAPNEM